MKVPFLALKEVNNIYQEQMNASMQRVMDTGWYVQGQELEYFEEEFALYCNAQYCIGVGNGLDALRLLLVAYGIGPGDEVIVPSNTFIATWLAVTQCGAVPVPAEPDPRTYNIDPTNLEDLITPRTAAIIPVHLYGQPADMDLINDIAKKYHLVVIEDAAQSQGATYKNRSTGSLGNAAATSFYPGKNLGALGDGGAILTNDHTIARKVKELRNYGSSCKYKHDSLGFNSRLDEIQASFLRIKLQDLDNMNAHRSRVADHYTKALSQEAVITPYVPSWAKPVWHLYVIRTKQRDELQSYLSSKGVETLVHYPLPPHRQKCYENIFGVNLPIADEMSKDILSLPISPVIKSEQVEYVIETLITFLKING